MQGTIEYMILIPVLILQIFLFPMFVSVAMGQWTGDRQTLELQETASSLASVIEQTYLSLNHTSILSCKFNSTLPFPATIEGYNYTAIGSLQSISDSNYGSSKVLSVTMSLVGKQLSTSTEVTLGQNVAWVNSVLVGNPPTACLVAEKFANQTIQLSFGS
ncbi:MAG TPA: hypothetical protein VLV84_02245 [Candidatus Acidoferrales bacterium]|nr:hypothetical protein [Candidatus Acidoferrales bacterium]